MEGVITSQVLASVTHGIFTQHKNHKYFLAEESVAQLPTMVKIVHMNHGGLPTAAFMAAPLLHTPSSPAT
jgi:hypothetical protein